MKWRMSRLLASCAVLIGVCACSEVSRLNPGGPASGNPAPPPGPAPPAAPTPSSGSAVYEGVVYEVLERGDPRPVPNLRLLVWDPLGGNGRVGATRRPDVTSDESGRIRFLGGGGYFMFLETPPGSPVRFICPSQIFGGGDVYVVDASWSGDRAPERTLWGFSSIQGKVTERVGALVQPAVGATVTLDDGSHMPPSVTNASGFYAICSTMGADFLVSVTARKDGYRPATVSFLWGWEYFVDLTLERN